MSPRDRLASLPPDARRAAIAYLDEISRPLEVRELDVALAQEGVSRKLRRPMIRALTTRFEVIVLEPRP